MVVQYNDSIEFFHIFCFCIAFPTDEEGIFSQNGIIYVRPQNTVTSSFLHRKISKIFLEEFYSNLSRILKWKYFGAILRLLRIISNCMS